MDADRPARHLRASTVLAVVAAIVAVVAIVLGIHTANMMREQVRAEVWPRVDLQQSAANETLQAVNKGVGPATIEHVSVRANRKPMRTWPDVFRELAVAQNPESDYRASPLGGLVLMPGETHVFLKLDQPGQFEILSSALAEGRAAITLCYCSTLRECWLAGHDPEREGNRPRQIADCRGLGPAEDEFAE